MEAAVLEVHARSESLLEATLSRELFTTFIMFESDLVNFVSFMYFLIFEGCLLLLPTGAT